MQLKRKNVSNFSIGDCKMYGLTHNDFPVQSWQLPSWKRGYGSDVVMISPEDLQAQREAEFAHIPFKVDPRFPLAEKYTIQQAIDLIQGEPFKASGHRPPQSLENIKGYLRNAQRLYNDMISESPELADRSIPCVTLDVSELYNLKRKNEIDDRTFKYCIRRKSADTQGYLIEIYKAEIAKQEAIKASGGMTPSEVNKARMMEVAMAQMQNEVKNAPNAMLLEALQNSKEELANMPAHLQEMAKKSLALLEAEAERRGLKPTDKGARSGQNIHSAAQVVSEPTGVKSIFNTGKNKVGIEERFQRQGRDNPLIEQDSGPLLESLDMMEVAKAERQLRLKEAKAADAERKRRKADTRRKREAKQQRMIMLGGVALAALFLVMKK